MLPYQGNYRVRSRMLDTTTGSTTAYTDYINFALGSTTTTPFQDEPIGDCDGITDFGCHFKKAMIWLLYPSESAIAQWYSLNESLEPRRPFVYLYEVGDLRDELFNASSTASTTIGVTVHGYTFTFLSPTLIASVPYANTIKIILGWLLWLLFELMMNNSFFFIYSLLLIIPAKNIGCLRFFAIVFNRDMNFALVIGLGVALLVFRFGWRKLRGTAK